MTAAKAKKPDGRADVCLEMELSALNTNLMAQVLTRKNLQQAWSQCATSGSRFPPEADLPLARHYPAANQSGNRVASR